MATKTFAYIEARGFHLRGAVGAIALGTCAATVAMSAPLVRFDEVSRAAMTAGGWALFMLGAGVRCWATLYVGGRKVGGRREARLTVDGPYSIVRNPLYVGSLLCGLSAALLLHSAMILLAVIAAALHYALVTVPAEEEFLRREVGGEAFDDYCRRTPRFVPNCRLYHSRPDVEVYVKAVRNEGRRLLRVLAVPVALTVIASLRYVEWWPAVWRLP